MTGLDLSGQDLTGLDLLGVDENNEGDEEFSLKAAKEKIIQNIEIPASWREKIPSFRASRRRISSIEQLKNTPNIVDVRLSGTNIFNISPLSACFKLANLDISGTMVEDITPLSSLNGIMEIDISDTNISDVSPLSSCRVFYFRLANCPVKDISMLKIEFIKNITLSGTAIESIDNLGVEFDPYFLDLSNTNISSVSILRDSGNIRHFYADNSKIRSFSPLAGKDTLRTLSITGCDVDDFSFLGTISNIDRIYLDRTNVRNITPLRGLNNLRHLVVSDTAIADISALNELKKLSILNISRTLVEDISYLGACHNLEFLDISGTRVKKLDSLTGFDRLVHLNISNCKYISLEEVYNLKVGNIVMKNISVADFNLDLVNDKLFSVHLSEDPYSMTTSPKGWSKQLTRDGYFYFRV